MKNKTTSVLENYLTYCKFQKRLDTKTLKSKLQTQKQLKES